MMRFNFSQSLDLDEILIFFKNAKLKQPLLSFQLCDLPISKREVLKRKGFLSRYDNVWVNYYEGGLGAFFGIPILTILGLINIFFLPILPNIFTDLFYHFVSFPPLNIFIGLACLWSSIVNFKYIGKSNEY